MPRKTVSNKENNIDASPEEIVKIHRLIVESLQGFITHRIKIDVEGEPDQNWHRTSSFGRNNEVYFHMQDIELGQRRGMRSGDRGTCPVNQIKPLIAERSDSRPWVAWRDEWISKGNRRFVLKSAAFTFFDGNLYEVKDQLFRAEWVQKDYGGDFGSQPHWHIDWPLTIFNSDDNMGGIHLAMAGWEQQHSSKSSPTCWQRTLGTDWKSLIEWASLTLEYSRDQLYRFYYS